MKVRAIALSLLIGMGAFFLLYSTMSAGSIQAENADFCDSVTQIPEAECKALVDLYNATDGANWKDNTGWLVDTLPCDWYGVDCFGNQVRNLDLVYNGLTGTIPGTIGQLTNLVTLELSSNGLTGTIPVEVGNLTTLEILSLDWNDLSGEIPDSLAALTKMRHFELADNAFTGEFPAWIADFQQLESLYMIQTKLSGGVPPALWDIPTLEFINLYNNVNMDWTLPANLGNATELYTLNLGQTGLHGPIPASIGNLTKLEFIYLPFNDLSGPLPSTLANLVLLDWLDLHYNPNLTGEVPAGLANATLMEEFHFYYTQLCMPDDAAFMSWFLAIPDAFGTSQSCTGGHSISGQIDLPEPSQVDIKVYAYSPLGTTDVIADADGNYTVTNLITETYTVRPDSDDHEFTPANRMVDVPPDQSGQDFTARRAEVVWVGPDYARQLVFTDTEKTAVTIDFPVGAVAEPTIFKLYPLEPQSAPTDYVFANHAFELNAYDTDGNLIPDFDFEKEATVTITYLDSDVVGVAENELALFYLDGDTWLDAACKPYMRDLDNNSLSLAICHLTEFGLFGPKLSESEDLFLPFITR